MHIQLGNIIYQGIKTFSSISDEQESVLAEYAIISMPARLQGMAQGLRTLSLSLFLHQEYCRVAEEVDRLRQAQSSFEVLPLLWGNGKVEGDFIITNISRTINQTDETGNIIACTLNISLKQYIVNDKLTKQQQQALSEAFAAGDKKPPAKSSRVNARTCPQIIAGHVKVTKSNAAAVNGYMQAYNNDSTVNHKLYKHLNNIIETAQKIADAAGNQSSCAYNVTGLSSSANNVTARAQALRSDIAYYIALIVKPIVISNLSEMKAKNNELQAAVRALASAASPLLKSSIVKK